MQVIKELFKKALKKFPAPTELANRRVILGLLESDESAQVLDLGSGDGTFTLEIGKRVGTDKLYCVDLVAEFIQRSEARGIKGYRSDLNCPLPFGNETFDVVHANQVLEHLHHTDLFIKEIHRVLNREGYAIISTPNSAAWHNIFCLLLGWQPFSASISDEINAGNPLDTRGGLENKYPVHLRIPTYEGLRELLQYHGFKVERIVGVGYYPWPAGLSRIPSRLDPRHSVYLTIKARKV